MNAWNQLKVVLRLHLRTARYRKGALLLIFGGSALVVFALLILLSLGEGIRQSYAMAGDPNYAIVLSKGTLLDWMSTLSPEWVENVMQAPGVHKDRGSEPQIDAETVSFVVLPKRNGDLGYTTMRGVGTQGPNVIPGFRLLEGRMPRPDSNEIAVGSTARQKFAGLDIGNRVVVREAHLGNLYAIGDGWKVVGVFATGSIIEGDLICDRRHLMEVRPSHTYNSVVAHLDAPDSLKAFQDFIVKTGAPVTIESLSSYWKRRWEAIPSTLYIINFVVGTLFSLGIFSGIMHMMESAISARLEEIGVLRALGFDGAVISASFIVEAMLLAVIGAGIGASVDWLWLDGTAYNGAWGVFPATVNARLFMFGALWALGIACLGVMIPAVRAAKTAITEAIAA